MAAINLDIGGDTRRLDRDIQRTVNKTYNINLKTKGDAPLGRITGKVDEFNKSLDASNARVIAFGATTGVIFGVQKAFRDLVSTTIEVQKQLKDINVLLNLSTASLNQFGSELFKIAKNTGQAFNVVAEAAQEFSRQGLGLTETLKRTNEALILSRLSGLGAAQSVEALTAAVNSYAAQAVTATEIVNKFANVDASFAVSSKDLAEALGRVGSSAAQAGISLDELIAIVTTAQQTTARGGSVIGNSFKTIFTRLQRGKVVELLQGVGVETTNAQGQIKGAIELLQDLANVYDKLGTLEQASIAEQVGGVFQINILKAALGDLGKEYSIYNNALKVSANTTDEAIRRNEELNKTYAAQLNALQENIKQISSTAGGRLITPVFERVVGGSNKLLDGLNESDGEGIGATLGKGILDGLGQFIAGPGLAVISGLLFKLFKDVSTFASGSFKTLLGLNTAANQQRDLQQSISQILSKNPKLLELALQGQTGLNQAANTLLGSLQKQTVELQKQAGIAGKISQAFFAKGVRVRDGVPIVAKGGGGRASGYIPNFAEESRAKELGAKSNVKAVRGVGKIGGKSFEANNQELQIRNFANTGETAVIPKYGNGIKEATKMIASGESGSILDKSDRKKSRAKGFIPNFAKQITYGPGIIKGPQSSLIADKNLDTYSRFFLNNISLGTKSIFNEKFDKELKNLNSSDSRLALKATRFFQRNGYSQTQISALQQNLLSNKKNVPSLLANNRIVNQTRQISGVKNNVLGKNLFEKFAARKLGLARAVDPNSRLDLVDKKGKGVAEVKFGRFSEDNVVSKIIETVYGRNKFKDGNFDSISLPSNFKLVTPGLANGFIPNFAQQKEPPIQLGNLDKIPNKLGNKVLSLIYPGLSTGYTLKPATARYLNKQYTGNIPVAGINKKTLKSQLPDLDKNVGNLLVREANQFGQALGGFNFLKSPDELPNYGAVKSAVGTAFEGGVGTLLQQKVGRQNAGIDFRNITPRLRSIFNNAPGIYDAKRSPELTNEVLQKLLNETKPGAIVQKRSGKAGSDYAKQRTAAVEQLRKEGVTGSVAIRQALRDRFGIVGRAEGFIPNFAAIQDAVNRERSAGIPQNEIYLAQEKALTKANPTGLGVFNKRDEPNRAARKSAMKQKGFSRGYVPNFAIDDPDVQASSLSSSIGALVAQLGFLAFSLTGFSSQYKSSLRDLTQSNVTAAKLNIKAARDEFGARSTQSREATKQFKRAQKGSLGQRLESAGKAGGFALAIGAPIIGETLKNAFGQETASARKAGATASTLGQIGSFAGTGALFGPKGAAVGLVAGSLLTIPSLINEFSSKFPELSKAATKSSEALSEFNNLIGQVAQASQNLKDAYESNDPARLQKAQDEYAQTLINLSQEDQERLKGKTGADFDKELEKIQTKRQSTAKLDDITARTAAQADEISKPLRLWRKKVTDTLGSEAEKFTKTSFVDALLVGAQTPAEQLERLQSKQDKAIELAQIRSLSERGPITQADQESLRNLLNDLLPEDLEGKAGIIEETIRKASASTEQWTITTNVLASSVLEATKKTEKGIELSKAVDSSVDESNKARTQELAAIDATISTIQKNIAVNNLLASTLDSVGENLRGFYENLKIEQELTKPREVLESIIGADASPVRRLAAREGLAKIEEERKATSNAAALDLKNAIRDILQKPFQENIDKLVEDLGKKGGALQGSPEKIIKESKLFQDQAKKQRDQLNSVMVNVEGLMGQFLNKQIDITQLLEASRDELSKVGINVSRGTQASNDIELAVENYGVQQVNELIKAFQQRKQLALDTKQAILESRIQAALGTFGGFEGFMNRPSEEQNYIERISPSLNDIRRIRGSTPFRYNNRESIKEQEKQAPELGRAFANVYRELISQSGGAFKDFLQETVEKGFQQTGRESRSGRAGASELGGFDDIIRGVEVDLRNQLKLAEDAIKTEKDPVLRRDLQGFIDSIKGLNLKDVARLQTQKEFGVARESDFKKTFDRYRNDSLQKLSELSPELASALSSTIKITDDPILQESKQQTLIQGQIENQLGSLLKAFDIEYAKIPQSQKTDSKAKGYLPALNQESRAISRGVGGAKAGDKPQFIPNLNGSPAFVNSGEKLVDNYGGSGQTAVLTRDMQKGMAEGFIPNFADTKKIPRPWELTPGTSMGYQMLMGDGKDSMKERLRKGLAQFIGRYATNIKEPVGYHLPEFLGNWFPGSSKYGDPSSKSIPKKIWESLSAIPYESILKDTGWGAYTGSFPEDVLGNREILYREMFDLPQRRESVDLKKIGEKQYEYDLIGIEGKVWPEDIRHRSTRSDLLGGVYLEPTPDGGAKFNDKWNIVSSSEEGGRPVNGPQSTAQSRYFSLSLRKMVDKILRPAYVSGTIPPPKNMAEGFIPNFAPSTADIFQRIFEKQNLSGYQEFINFKKNFIDNGTRSGSWYIKQNEAYKKLSPAAKEWLSYQGKLRQYKSWDKMLKAGGSYYRRKVSESSLPVSGPAAGTQSKVVQDTFRSGFRGSSAYVDDLVAQSRSAVTLTPADEAAIAKYKAEKGQTEAKKPKTKQGKASSTKPILKKAARFIPYGIGTAAGAALTFADEQSSAASTTETVVRTGLQVLGSIAGGLIGIPAGGGIASIATATAGAIGGQQLGAVAGDLIFGKRSSSEEMVDVLGSVDPTTRKPGRTGKRTPEEQEALKNRARYEYADAFGLDWPLKTESEEEFEKRWSAKPSSQSVRSFVEEFKSFAPGRPEMKGPRKGTQDDIDYFFKRGRFAPTGSKERTQARITEAIGSNQQNRFGVRLNEETPLFEDPIQRNIRKGLWSNADGQRLRSQLPSSETLASTRPLAAVGPTINGRPAIEWENEAKIEAMDDKVKRGEISQKRADEILESELSKSFIDSYRKKKPEDQVPKTQVQDPDFQKKLEEHRAAIAKNQKVIDETDKWIMDNNPSPEYSEKRSSSVAKPLETAPPIDTVPKTSSGVMSEETARSIVQELDMAYNEAIRNQKNPQIAKSWAQTQQRYRLLYKTGKFQELDKFYKSINKNYSSGFIPNFSKDYISNLGKLESGLSGEKSVLGYDKKIGMFMSNKGQPKNLDAIISRDHPEGKMKAIKNSMKMQKSAGVMNKGYIPNFAATDQSFAQQEAAFNNNTSALTLLAGGIESLNSTLSNFEANFANLNNTPGAQPAGAQAGGAQPNITTTTTAPVNLVLNAQGSNDIAAAVGEEIQKSIPTIINRVRVALGQKVPPESSP
jgi:TP901 family phage tail tape measure protein